MVILLLRPICFNKKKLCFKENENKVNYLHYLLTTNNLTPTKRNSFFLFVGCFFGYLSKEKPQMYIYLFLFFVHFW